MLVRWDWGNVRKLNVAASDSVTSLQAAQYFCGRHCKISDTLAGALAFTRAAGRAEHLLDKPAAATCDVCSSFAPRREEPSSRSAVETGERLMSPYAAVRVVE